MDAIEAFESSQRPNRKGFDSLRIDELMRRFRVPGMQVATIHNFAIHWAKGYGLADVESHRKVDADTPFQAGSISKPVAAMALLKAVQDGCFSLDDDINCILRTWKLPYEPSFGSRLVTPRMLASHTAGLGDGFGFPGYAPEAALPTTVQILNGEPPSNTGPVRMDRAPLSAMKYSGGGSTILELALQDAVGRPFAQLIREGVLELIGMKNSAYDQPPSPAFKNNAACGHNADGAALAVRWHVYPELYAAGLWSTATDLAKFALEIQKSIHGESNRVLSKSTVQEMANPVGVGDYAVGFRIERKGQGWYMSHTGSTEGFGSLLTAHKVNGYGISVMTNSHYKPEFVNEIRERIERVYGWDSLDKPVPR